MKKNFISVLILVNTFFQGHSVAQTNHQLIRISPEIGDTINVSERNYYNLFSEIKNFQCAEFYLNEDSTSTISRVTYVDAIGILVDTIIIYPKDYVGNLKAYIRQMNADRLENFKSGAKVRITKLGGSKFSGKLVAIQNSCIIACPDSISSPSAFIFLKTYVRFNTEEIESVFIEVDSNPDVIWGAFIGSIVGLVLGVVVGSNQPESDIMSPEFGVGVIGTAVGALAGAGVGYLISPADQRIEINSTNDIELLKKYVLQ